VYVSTSQRGRSNLILRSSGQRRARYACSLAVLIGLNTFAKAPPSQAANTCKRPQIGKVPTWARLGLENIPHVTGENNLVVGFVFADNSDEDRVKVLWVTSTDAKQLSLTTSNGTSTFPPAAGTKRSFPSNFVANGRCMKIQIRWGKKVDRVVVLDVTKR
jgi:hypothetical protein